MKQTRTGLCSVCGQPAPAQLVFRDNRVLFRKDCSACGTTESLVSNDRTAWQRKRDIWQEDLQEDASCKLDCRTCGVSHTPTVAFVDVTNRCNMNCPICIANIRAMGFDFNPPQEYFEKIFRELGRLEPAPMIEMFGGEPTLRDDILDLVKLARRHGLKSRLVTNGLKLANEDYCRKLCEEGVRFLLALDGIHPEVYARLRKSGDACEKKLRALAHIEKYSRRRHTILCCVARSINDAHMADLLQYIHDHASRIDTLGLIPLTENWSPGDFESGVNTTREDVERIIEESVPGGKVEFVPAGITHYLSRMREFFRPKSISEHLILGGVHPDCETVSFLVSDGRQFRSADHWLRVPFASLASDLMRICRRVDGRLARLDRDRLPHRILGQALVLWSLAPLALRAVDFRALFKGHLLLSPLRMLLGRLRGLRGRSLTGRYMDFPRFLRLVVFPFEEYHTLDSAKLRNCRAVFAYEDVASGKVRSIPACAWNTFRNDILRQIAHKYGTPSQCASGNRVP